MHDDFDAAASYLSERCVYDSPKGPVKGRESIIDAYRAASAWAHATFDEVAYESQVEQSAISDTETVAVIYTDRIREGELWHTHKCRQLLTLDPESSKIVAISYQTLEGEGERLNEFFVASRVVTPTDSEVVHDRISSHKACAANRRP
ncbi:nuclear transport factor 2 family protein [Methylosinus sp. Ce-a6]|uniref:nuclear transport factor 2 family protein n=1 Tax=Methylosinus sp. Ce-a6 TaxID=2172005 RepID=UPI00135B0695|nr:nuclear transport factor 2 family protein [Methylosinus sp. Ce-a6]